jgi:hypothetical protein
MLEKPKEKISRHQNHFLYVGNKDIHYNIKERNFFKQLTDKQKAIYFKNIDAFFIQNKKFHTKPKKFYYDIIKDDIIGFDSHMYEVKMIENGNMFLEKVDNELVDTGETKYVTFLDIVKIYHTSYAEILYRNLKPYKDSKKNDSSLKEEEKDDKNST